ncbi:MAG: hypothetical protein HZA79_02260 [Sphingobacteriales bacterium]|nr:hypothetical protein [Sphingobacteriales bacterium]
MKNLFGLTLLFLIACSDKTKSNESEKIHLSAAQNGIQNLVDSFKLEYKKGNTQALRDKYKQKLYDYLADNYIDSIRVHVDTVIIDSLTITTAFHCNKDIAFKYSLTFKKIMAPNEDSLFRFMKGLKVGSDTTINFAYTGAHELNDPHDTSLPTLRIFAFPTPNFSDKR